MIYSGNSIFVKTDILYMENREEICKEFRERWAKLGLTDNIKDDIENNASNLTN